MKVKLQLRIVDKHKIFHAKGKYDSENRIVEIKRGRKNIERFEVDPDHIYEEFSTRKRRLVAFLDNANRKSITIERVKKIVEDGKKKEEKVQETVEAGQTLQIHNNDPVDQKKANTLDFLCERKFWTALLEKRKLALSTMIILLFAGVGLYHGILVLLRALGFQV